MKKSLLLPSMSACALALAALFSGCSGGGGGGGVATPTNTPLPTATEAPGPTAVPIGNTTPTPVATSISGVCTPNSYLPNYSPAVLPTVDEDDYLLRWSGFPIRIFIEPIDDATRAITVRGLNRWVTAMGGRINYQIVTTRGAADMQIDYDAIAESGVLGTATNTFNPSNAVIVQSAIVLDFEGVNNDLAKEYVVAHEFGHALGLSLHSNVSADLMFPTIGNRTPLPTTRDVNTMRTAYCDSFPVRNPNAIRAAQNGPLRTVTHKIGKGGCTLHAH